MPKNAQYASRTGVGAERTRGEIERELGHYGATGFVYATRGDVAIIEFEMGERRVRLRIPLPSRGDFAYTATRQRRTSASQAREHQAEVNRRWRVVKMLIVTKLEAIKLGIATFDDEFLADIVMGDGSTVGDQIVPRLTEIAATGMLPPLLPAPRETRA